VTTVNAALDNFEELNVINPYRMAIRLKKIVSYLLRHYINNNHEISSNRTKV
jgi:hypothetical protein